MGFVASVCQPSTLRMLIWPEASSAQNHMAAVSADGSTVCVLILRLNSSCSCSTPRHDRGRGHCPPKAKVVCSNHAGRGNQTTTAVFTAAHALFGFTHARDRP